MISFVAASPGHLAGVAQVSFDNVGFRYAFLATVIAVIAVVTLVVIKTFFKNSDTDDFEKLDLNFLDKVGQSNQLTPDEMKKVRDAMVRRAIERKQDKPTGTGMGDLMRIASGFEPPAAEQAAAEQKSRETAAPAPAEARTENPSSTSDDAGDGGEDKAVGLEALLEKGIITRKEYEQMTGRSRPPRQD